MRTTIISMAMMASSTSRPSEMIRAPSVMRSKSRPVTIITTNTAESVSGTASATTMPTRKPSATRLTTITTESAVKNFTMNSWMASSMTFAWSVILVKVMPVGSSWWIATSSALSASPSARPLKPGFITRPSIRAGSPSLRIAKTFGSS